jgi:hypothetical protein
MPRKRAAEQDTGFGARHPEIIFFALAMKDSSGAPLEAGVDLEG